MKTSDIAIFVALVYGWYYFVGVFNLALVGEVRAGIALILTILSLNPILKLLGKVLK